MVIECVSPGGELKRKVENKFKSNKMKSENKTTTEFYIVLSSINRRRLHILLLNMFFVSGKFR